MECCVVDKFICSTMRLATILTVTLSRMSKMLLCASSIRNCTIIEFHRSSVILCTERGLATIWGFKLEMTLLFNMRTSAWNGAMLHYSQETNSVLCNTGVCWTVPKEFTQAVLAALNGNALVGALTVGLTQPFFVIRYLSKSANQDFLKTYT